MYTTRRTTIFHLCLDKLPAFPRSYSTLLRTFLRPGEGQENPLPSLSADFRGFAAKCLLPISWPVVGVHREHPPCQRSFVLFIREEKQVRVYHLLKRAVNARQIVESFPTFCRASDPSDSPVNLSPSDVVLLNGNYLIRVKK